MEALFTTGAYKVAGIQSVDRQEIVKPVIYTSSKIGLDYITVDSLQNSPRHWQEAVRYLCDAIDANVGRKNVDKISGGEVRDLLFSVPVANQLGVPHVTIRKTDKPGSKGKISGSIERGERIVHVADLMNYGSSLDMWIPTIRGHEGKIEWYFEVFDRNQGGNEKALQYGVKNVALCRRDESFMRRAIELGHIRPEQRDIVLDYVRDPERWAREFLRANPGFVVENTAVDLNGEVLRKDRDGISVLERGYQDLIPELKSIVEDLFIKRGNIRAFPIISARESAPLE